MVTFSTDEDVTTKHTPALAKMEPTPKYYHMDEQKVRICDSCRFYAKLWLGFCCTMLGVVIPLIIIRVSDMPESSANIFALVAAIGGLSAYLFLRPSQIRKADKQFADMDYHAHLHL